MARLVYLGNGISGQLDATQHEVVQPVRTAPSGGALYPIEIYPVVISVKGVEPGLYHYAVDRHGLELILPGRLEKRLSEITFDDGTFSRASVAFILTGVFGRPHFKYGERGYRFALLEAGHICQNLLLAATSLRLGAVAVGGFIDDELNELLDLDGIDESAVYLIAAGHPLQPAAAREETRDKLIADLFSTLWSRELADKSK
jgi:SagB-type dehydrogenase family enzyme